MVDSFSGAYYLTQMMVCPHVGERAVMSLKQFEQFQRDYANTLPLVFKLDTYHLPVYGETPVPNDTIAVPPDVFEDLNMSEPERRNVLLAKREAVDLIVSGFTLPEVAGERGDASLGR